MTKNLVVRMLLVMAFSFLCSKIATAQKGLAFSGGVQYSRIITYQVQSAGSQGLDDLNPAFGFAAGFDYRFGLHKNLDLKQGLRYSNRNSTSTNFKYRFYYLELLLSAKIQIKLLNRCINVVPYVRDLGKSGGNFIFYPYFVPNGTVPLGTKYG